MSKKPEKSKISIEFIKRLHRHRSLINSEDLENIEFYEKGKKVDIDPKLIEEFKFTGLNNIDFIVSGYYKGEYTIEDGKQNG